VAGGPRVLQATFVANERSIQTITMIDWYFVFGNSLWIFGLSIALAVFSYHDWLRVELGTGLRQQLRQAPFLLASNVGFLFVALGLALLESSRWWGRLLWFLLACSFGWSAWSAGRAMRRPTDRRA